MRKPTKMEVFLSLTTVGLAGALGVSALRGGFGESTAAPGAIPEATGCPDRGHPNPDPEAIEKYCKKYTPPASAPASGNASGDTGGNCGPLDGNNVTMVPDQAFETAEVTNNGPDCIAVHSVMDSSVIGSVNQGEGFTATCINLDNQTIRIEGAGAPRRTGYVEYVMGTITMAQEGGYAMQQC
jgi:hypothetical protein